MMWSCNKLPTGPRHGTTRDQQDLSDFLLKIVVWVLLVMNLRSNRSNISTRLNRASGFMGSCGRKTFYFKFLNIQNLWLSTQPSSLIGSWENIFYFIYHTCCQNNVGSSPAIRSAGSDQPSLYCRRDATRALTGAVLKKVGLGLVVGVYVIQGTCFSQE